MPTEMLTLGNSYQTISVVVLVQEVYDMKYTKREIPQVFADGTAKRYIPTDIWTKSY